MTARPARTSHPSASDAHCATPAPQRRTTPAGHAEAFLAPWPRPSIPAGATAISTASHLSTMTTERPDLYAILGVPPSATQAQISHAYRALLRRHHPDTRATSDESDTPGSDTTLQQVIAAYTVLHDPARRAAYDRQARPREHPAHRRAHQPPNHSDTYDQPPIIAGPVRWHRAPHPPSP